MRRASSVGPEHVLLAIAADPDAPAARILGEIGLDYAGIAWVLRAERARSLAVADVTPVVTGVLEAARSTAKPRWGASVRGLLRAADKSAVKSAVRVGAPGALERELVVGILRAELGTVPRMLALGGFDRRTLIQHLSAT
ncbi:MAG TPA: Clp protease N-terminal domain-containing protein [Galbitalea sp.]|jgi:hypothetical protein|nr:Clp protease N-terminal domain-containing protein [Galbitalea sp.]